MTDAKTSTLWARPENGTYYFRKGVPERLQPLVGKTMMQISLRTRDLPTAMAKHKLVAAEVAKQWSELEKAVRPAIGPLDDRMLVSLTGRDIASLSGEIYSEFLAKHDQEPGTEEHWKQELLKIQRALPPSKRLPEAPKRFLFEPPAGHMAVIVFSDQVEALLKEKQIKVSLEHRRRLSIQTAIAMAQAYEVMLRRAKHDWSPDPFAARFPPPVSFGSWETWYPAYCDARLPEPSSQKRQRGVLSALFKFLGHDVPGRVTQADAVRWMEHRLTQVSPRTVRTADMAHPKSFFKWAKGTKRLIADPFAEIEVPSVSKRKLEDGTIEANEGKRGYDLEEAQQVLECSLVVAEGRLSEHSRRTRRWVPWLCAYTGARVGEITQLRKQDVKQVKSADRTRMIWVISITPEAGRVKDHEKRDVAIHPHLLEQGFTDFAASSETETLFFDSRRYRGGSAANPQSAKASENLASWVRKTVKITDPRIAPNHAWRHRFRGELKGVVSSELLDAVDGHAPASEGHKYGSLKPEDSLATVSLIPAFRFDGKEMGWTKDCGWHVKPGPLLKP